MGEKGSAWVKRGREYLSDLPRTSSFEGIEVPGSDYFKVNPNLEGQGKLLEEEGYYIKDPVYRGEKFLYWEPAYQSGERESMPDGSEGTCIKRKPSQMIVVGEDPVSGYPIYSNILDFTPVSLTFSMIFILPDNKSGSLIMSDGQ